jgi:hypothetical protein
MARQQHQPNPRVRQIFDDLERYLAFCQDYGYKFDESTLYDMRNYAWQQYTKCVGNKNFKDQWADDARKMNNVVTFD